MRKKIFGVTCTGDGYLHKLTVLTWLRMLQDRRYDLRFQIVCERPFENALHHAVVEFLQGDCDYFLNVDSDQGATGSPLGMVELDKDIISQAVPVYHCDSKHPGDRPYYTNGYRAVDGGYKEFQPAEGIQEVCAVGTGIMLIARRVLEDPVMRLAPFKRTTDEFGRVEYGNDLNFCRRAKERGFRVWMDYRHVAEHMVAVPLLEAIRAFNGVRESVAVSRPPF